MRRESGKYGESGAWAPSCGETKEKVLKLHYFTETQKELTYLLH